MAQISVTFVGDPRGVNNEAIANQDPKITEYHGKHFPKGKAVAVDDEGWIAAHGANLRTNNHFKVSDKVSGAAAASETVEPDDPTEGMNVEDLRVLAEQHGIAHDGMKKAELREAIREKMAG